MLKLFANRKISIIALAVLILIIGFPGMAGMAATAKAATLPNNWTAQPLFIAQPASTTSNASPYVYVSSPYAYMDPSQIKEAYNLPTRGTPGAGETIAIVDAYNDPTVQKDLTYFSNYFGLPTPASTSSSTTFVFEEHMMSYNIQTNSGWALEISLDVEWAHAIAPYATILLVEASSNSLADLLSAVSYAKSQPNVAAVSMSWGASEFSTEATYDNYFTSNTINPNIVFFAASGDSGAGVIWPSASPNVVSVGGTTLTLPTSGPVTPTTVTETTWSGSGGGVSAYEPAPSYQTRDNLGYSMRATPDVSYDANPNTGVDVYDSIPYVGQSGWWEVGGTSLGSPCWAAIQAIGLTANNDNFYTIYQNEALYSSDFRLITSGPSNGNPVSSVGYDLITGLGSPLTTNFAVRALPRPLIGVK